MQKYGFREGQGLGKHEQGLSTALSVEKTSKRGGKIIVGEVTEKGGSSPGVGGAQCGGDRPARTEQGGPRGRRSPPVPCLLGGAEVEAGRPLGQRDRAGGQ